MTLAEKFYRMFYKVAPEVKLTNDQWKAVNMVHAALKESNKPKLPHGKILVDKKQLVGHLKSIEVINRRIDQLMLAPENKHVAKSKLGSDIAKVANAISLTTQSIKHLQLDIPLEKVHEDFTDED